MKEKDLAPLKTVFISGAAGGLGTALVKEYSGKGYQVIATDIDTQGLSRINSLDQVTAKTLDVTNIENIASIKKEFDLDKRGLDILVCLAGIYHTYPVTEEDPDLFKKIIAVNLLGTASLIQGLLQPLIKNKGRVIVVTSESYKIQAMFQPYMISKAALEAYCRVARQELALKDVKLIVIRPGAIRTPLLGWMNTEYDQGKYPVFSEEFRESWKKSVKMVGKMALPETVAGKIMLASTASKPKRIYRINNSPILTMISMLPAGIFDRLTVKIFKSKDPKHL
jgi:NAD(P)-dependent dehydrogenase (short-subunit alcohol dehydrogenase family)